METKPPTIAIDDESTARAFREQPATGGRTRSLRATLLALTVPPLLLLAAAGGYIVWNQWVAQRDALHSALQDSASRFALAVDRELAVDRTRIETLAASPLIDEGQFRSLHELAGKVAAGRHGALIALVDATGQPVFATAAPFGAQIDNLYQIESESRVIDWNGTPLPLISPGQIRAAFESGQPTYSDLFYGIVLKRPALSVAVPVLREGFVRYVLVFAFPAALLESLLQQSAPKPEATTTLADRAGRIIASSDLALRTGQAVPGVGARPGEGVERVGRDELLVDARTGLSGWTVRVAVPPDVAYAPARQALGSWLAVVLIAVAGTLALAYRLGRRLTEPLLRLTALARSTEPTQQRWPPSQVREIAVLSDALRRAAGSEAQAREARLRQQIAQERERLAREAAAGSRKRELQLRLALDARRMGTWRLDLATRRLSTDANLRTIWRLPDDAVEVDADQLLQRIHSADRQKVEAELDRAAGRTGHFDAEFRIVDADGGIRWLAASADRLCDLDGTPVELMGVNYDITPHRTAMEGLRESEERLRQLADTVSDVFWLADYPVRGRLYVSPACRRLWCIDDRSLASDPQAWLRHVHPDDRARVAAAYGDEALATEQELEYRLVPPDGRSRWVRDRTFPLRDGHGAVFRIAGVVTDITANRQLQEELRERSRELEAAARAKDHFLAMLGHELRNPLAAIRSSADLLAAGAGDAGTAQDASERIGRQVGHMSRLIDDLLDVARITENRILLQRAPVAVAPLLMQAVETAQPLIDARRHRLELDLPDVPIHVDGDSTRLVQVFSNLLTNAARYTEEGGTIRVEAALDAAARRVSITVDDNGIGLPASAIPSLFDPFAQHASALARSQGGLGIGLALVRRLVEMHGGEVAATSAGRGMGSRFTVTLPVTPAPAAETAETEPQPAAPPAPVRRRRVLVVDDNRDAADGIAMLLSMRGHDVRVAYRAQSALEQFASTAPEIAILDLGLPDMDGRDLARRLRRMPGGGEVRLVATTGYGGASDREAATAAGIDRYFVKPVDIDALYSLLESDARPARASH